MSAHLSATMEQRRVPDAVIGARTRQTTLARARDILAMTRMGLSKDDIADREQITPERVRQLLKLATSDPASVGLVSERPEGGTVSFPATRPSSRLTERTLVHRALLAMRTDYRLLSSPAAEQLLWLKSVQAIHALGDGHGLGFGQRGDGFKSRAEFAAALGGSDADLEALMDRGLLVDLEEDGIDLPSNIGLKPRPKTGGSPQRQPEPVMPTVASRPNGKASVPVQRSMLLGILGGATDGTKDASNPIFGPNFTVAKGKEFGAGPNFASEILVSSQISSQIPTKDLDSDAAISTTTTTNQVIDSIGSSGGNGSQGHAGGQNLEAPENLVDRQNLENLDAVAAAPPITPPWVSVAAELARLVGLSRPPTVAEGLLVQRWLNGFDAETIRGIIRVMMERPKFPLEPSLSYFDDKITGEIRKSEAAAREREKQRLTTANRPGAAGKSGMAVVPTRSVADQALDARLLALAHRYTEAPSGRRPPTRAEYDRLCVQWKPADALRWVTAQEAWWAAGAPLDVDLPEFRAFVERPNFHADDMAAAEAACAPPEKQASG